VIDVPLERGKTDDGREALVNHGLTSKPWHVSKDTLLIQVKAMFMGCHSEEGFSHAPSWPRTANNGRTRRPYGQEAHVTEALRMVTQKRDHATLQTT